MTDYKHFYQFLQSEDPSWFISHWDRIPLLWESAFTSPKITPSICRYSPLFLLVSLHPHSSCRAWVASQFASISENIPTIDKMLSDMSTFAIAQVPKQCNIVITACQSVSTLMRLAPKRSGWEKMFSRVVLDLCERLEGPLDTVHLEKCVDDVLMSLDMNSLFLFLAYVSDHYKFRHIFLPEAIIVHLRGQPKLLFDQFTQWEATEDLKLKLCYFLLCRDAESQATDGVLTYFWMHIEKTLTIKLGLIQCINIMNGLSWRTEDAPVVAFGQRAVQRHIPPCEAMPWESLKKYPGFGSLYMLLVCPHKWISDVFQKITIQPRMFIDVVKTLPMERFHQFPRTACSTLRVLNRVIPKTKDPSTVPFPFLWTLCEIICAKRFASGYQPVLQFVKNIPECAYVEAGSVGMLCRYFDVFEWPDWIEAMTALMKVLEGSAPGISEVPEIEILVEKLSEKHLNELSQVGGWVANFVKKFCSIRKRNSTDQIFDEYIEMERKEELGASIQHHSAPMLSDAVRVIPEPSSSLGQPCLPPPPRVNRTAIKRTMDDRDNELPLEILEDQRGRRGVLGVNQGLATASRQCLEEMRERDMKFAIADAERRRSEAFNTMRDHVKRMILGGTGEMKPMQGNRPIYDSPRDFADTFVPFILAETKADIVSQLAEKHAVCTSATTMNAGSHSSEFYSVDLFPSRADDDRPNVYANDVIVIVCRQVQHVALVYSVSSSNQRSQKISALLSKPLNIVDCAYRRLFSLHTVLGMIEMCFYVDRIPFSPYVLNPRISEGVPLPETKLDSLLGAPLMEYYHNHFNPSQIQAVSRCLCNTSLMTLIQGPPGTGKTQTILGVLSALITSARITGQQHIRILVCAVTNTAVDEAMVRVLKYGVRGNDGNAFRPKMCRMGLRERVHSEVISKGKFLDDIVRTKITEAGGPLHAQYETVRSDVLKSCSVVFSTIGALRDITSSFDTVIIDEAAQCTEPLSVWALSHAVRRCILIGDPMQLPATLQCPEAARLGYQKSLMERMVEEGHPYSLLNIQYRMHPTIAQFPNASFYGSKLKTGRRRSPAGFENFKGKRFLFLNVLGEERKCGTSYSNPDEIQSIIEFLQHLNMQVSLTDGKVSVGIITHYSAQKNELEQKVGGFCEVNTVDGFQGKEKDVILISCVRTTTCTSFLGDPKRINVAITRARELTCIVGHADVLTEHSTLWRDLIEYAKSDQQVDS
eukprot:PhF_6_TR6956/c0_g1_i1/m.10256/K10706/SETX, ALS4; senataxin